MNGGEGYRSLLKKASQNVKLGKTRAAVPVVCGLVMIIWALVEFRTELGIMGLLLSYIGYLQFTIYRLSESVFDGIGELSESMEEKGMR